MEILEGTGTQLGLSLSSSMYDVHLEAGKYHDLNYKFILAATEAVQMGMILDLSGDDKDGEVRKGKCSGIMARSSVDQLKQKSY